MASKTRSESAGEGALLRRVTLEGEVSYLGTAALGADPLGQTWVSFTLLTPSTGGPYWLTWVHAWVDELGQRVVACYDARGDGGGLEVLSRAGFDDIDEGDLDALRAGEDLSEVLSAVDAICAPGLAVAPATAEFVAQVQRDVGELGLGWEQATRGEAQ